VNADALGDRLESLVADLKAAGAPDETLGEFLPARGFGPFATAEKFRVVGRVWRLGVLLLDRDGRLYATGEITRAIEPGRAAVNRSPDGERRRALRLAAARSGLPRGEVVNFGYRALDTSAATVAGSEDASRPLSSHGGSIVVELEPGVVADLDGYLAERCALLVATLSGGEPLF
jgi:hypothetical protein